MFNIESEQENYDFLPEISADDEADNNDENLNQPEEELPDTEEGAFEPTLLKL